jgi:UDP-N-acetylmuramate--alanine ligase
VADIYATNIVHDGMKTYFTVHRPALEPLDICINLPGRHNVLNSLSAIAVAMEIGVTDQAIVCALQKFAGVGRRCQILGDFKIKNKQIKLIDDYGHHPREIAATQQAIHAAHPHKRLVTVFQPHRYSRTKTLFDDFAQVLSEIDVLLLLEVYSAGEEPIVGADTRTLCGSIRQRKKVDPIFVEDHTKLIEILGDVTQDGDIILMQGAGNIGALVQTLAKTLSSA